MRPLDRRILKQSGGLLKLDDGQVPSVLQVGHLETKVEGLGSTGLKLRRL